MSEAYFEKVVECLKTIKETQAENIGRAAAFVAETIKSDGLIRPFGTGHSHLVALEIYMRAGGFVPVAPLLESNLMLYAGGRKSSALERMSGYAAVLLSLHDVTKKDTLIIISQSGRNNVPVEMAMEGKKRGLKTIAITSLAHSKSVLSRHPSGKRLFEIADLSIDTCTPVGDAAVEIPEMQTAVAPLSTIAGVYIWHSIVLAAIEILLSEGIKPPVYMSANAPGGDVHNLELFVKYRGRVPF